MNALSKTVSEWEAQWASQEVDQERVNRAARVCHPVLVAKVVRAIADRRNAKYPQYADYWAGDEWELVQFTADVITKGGTRFERGDVTVARTVTGLFGMRSERTAYSIRGDINVAVGPCDYHEVK